MDDFELDSFENSIYKHSRTIIHIDIDCFYAQCEMLKNPELKNKPLGIKQKNYIITSNYIARSFGVKKCMLIPEAVSLCPQLVIVNGEDLYDYRKMSSSITDIIKGFTKKVEKLGFDENFADVSELVSIKLQEGIKPSDVVGHVYKNIVKNKCTCGCNERLRLGSVIAKEIRDKINETLHLTCSAGIGHNKLVAKLVGNEHKPDQQTTVYPSGVLALMSNLSSVQKIPGIGRKTSDILLNKLNIKTIADIQNSLLHELESQLGESISKWILKSSFGFDDSEVKITGKPQTLSIEDADRKIASIEEVQIKFSNLIERLLVLIREDGRLPTTIKITFRLVSSYKRENKQCNINPNIVNSETAQSEILTIAMQMFKSVVHQTKPFHLTLIGIGFTKFKDVYTGKKSIDSFFQKSTPCNSVSSKETMINNNSLMLHKNVNFDDYENIDYIPNKSRNEIPTTYNEKNSLPKMFKSSNEKKTAVLYLQNTTDQQKSSFDVATVDEIKTISCHNFSNTHKQWLDSNEILNCPEGLDKDIFYQLPANIQQELINNHKGQMQQENSNKNETTIKTNSVHKFNNKSKVSKKKKLSLDQTNKIQNYFLKS